MRRPLEPGVQELWRRHSQGQVRRDDESHVAAQTAPWSGNLEMERGLMSTSDKVNILMVDDQPSKLMSYEAILGDLDVSLVSASSAREALDRLLKMEIAIILMDVSMPEMDGFELAAMIRQHPRYQRIAIIFISAVRLTDLDRLKGYELGAVDYIPVPVIPEVLRAKVSVFADLYRTTRQLAALNRELERRVEERTAALEASTAREREARLAAEDAARARDEFLSIAAHELKTPVTGIRATAQVLARKLQREGQAAPDWMRNGLHTIDQQTERLSRLIAQVLDVSRLDQEKVVTHGTPTDLVGITEKLVAALQVRTSQHKFTLLAPEPVIALVDPIGIEQVLSNLLDNAVKYSPNGGAIEIEVHTVAPDRARISVRDHGLGIPPEKRDAIFERFYQAHSDDHRSGLGLGLYICRQILAQQGGAVNAEFPSDGGSCFVITLPLQRDTSGIAPQEANEANEADEADEADATARVKPRARGGAGSITR